MAARRSGFTSLVRRHQLQELLSGKESEQQDNKDVEKAPPTEGLRLAFGNEELGRFAQSVEQNAPWSAGALDLIFGSKQKLEETTKSNWASRPRPEKSALDLTQISDEYEKYHARKAEEARLGREAEERERIRKKDEQEKKEAAKAMADELAFAEIVEKKRTIFFGRQSQQIRLLKRGLQLDRNRSEYHCAVWKHLLEEATEEFKGQEEIFKNATKVKNAASFAADTLRGKEKGARQSAAQLKLLQLLDGSKASHEAAEAFALAAEEEEQKARVARAEAEDAKENMEIEQEKIRACEVQMTFNKHEARRILEATAVKEVEEILKVMEEETYLTDARAMFVAALNCAAPLSSLGKSYQDDVDKADRKVALLCLEQEVFVPSYVQIEKGMLDFKNNKDNVFTNVRKALAKQTASSNGGLAIKKFEWKEFPQYPGTVCLGRKRSRVVQENGQLQDLFKDEATLDKFRKSLFAQFDTKHREWCSLLKKLMPDDVGPILDRWNGLSEENLSDIKNCVTIFSEYFSKEDFFESREDKMRKAGARSILDKDVFANLWLQRHCTDSRARLNRARKLPQKNVELEQYRQDTSHELGPITDEPNKQNIWQIDRVTIRLRREPKQFWMTSWVESDKPVLSPLNNNPNLGPKFVEFIPVRVPRLHDEDTRGEILDADGRPRLYGILMKVLKNFNDNVQAGDNLIELKIFNERKMSPEMKYAVKAKNWVEKEQLTITAPASGKFIGIAPAIWKQKNEESRKKFIEWSETEGKERTDLIVFDWNQPKTHGFHDQAWVEAEMAKKKPSTDLLFNYNLKVFSYEIIAYIDQSEKGWEKRVLPVEEWPELFFRDYKYFFNY